jgi:hypothetical protein
MPKLLLTISSVALVALLTMAQISGPTTRTPRLTVGPGDTTVTDLIVLGECTGCGGGGTSEGTGTVSYTSDCTNNPNQGYGYALNGNIVSITFRAFSCTQDSSGGMFSDTSLPVAIRPAQNQYLAAVASAIDNGTPVLACFFVNTGGSVGWSPDSTDCDGSIFSWSTTGTTSIADRFTVTYHLGTAVGN